MTLAQFLAMHSINPTDAMNRLQCAGVISDLCVNVDDVAQADEQRAIEWLEGNMGAVGK